MRNNGLRKRSHHPCSGVPGSGAQSVSPSLIYIFERTSQIIRFDPLSNARVAGVVSFPNFPRSAVLHQARGTGAQHHQPIAVRRTLLLLTSRVAQTPIGAGSLYRLVALSQTPRRATTIVGSRAISTGVKQGVHKGGIFVAGCRKVQRRPAKL